MEDIEQHIDSITHLAQPFAGTKLHDSVVTILILLFHTYEKLNFPVQALEQAIQEILSDEFYISTNPNFDSEKFLEQQDLLSNPKTHVEAEHVLSLVSSLHETIIENPKQLFEYISNHIGSNNITAELFELLHAYYFIFCIHFQSGIIKFNSSVLNHFSIQLTTYIIDKIFPTAKGYLEDNLLFRVH